MKQLPNSLGTAAEPSRCPTLACTYGGPNHQRFSPAYIMGFVPTINAASRPPGIRPLVRTAKERIARVMPESPAQPPATVAASEPAAAAPKPAITRLEDASWHELLARFATAAISVYPKAFRNPVITKPDEMLWPPSAVEDLAETEKRFGEPIPRDIKEMSLVSHGFYGGWHFACGGFPGINTFELQPLTEEYDYLLEEYLEPDEDAEAKVEGDTKEEGKKAEELALKDCGCLWTAMAPAESDGFEHIICPPCTWKKIRRGRVKEGEYLYIITTNWNGGIDGCASVRSWVEGMTQAAEERREKGEMETDNVFAEEEEEKEIIEGEEF